MVSTLFFVCQYYITIMQFLCFVFFYFRKILTYCWTSSNSGSIPRRALDLFRQKTVAMITLFIKPRLKRMDFGLQKRVRWLTSKEKQMIDHAMLQLMQLVQVGVKSFLAFCPLLVLGQPQQNEWKEHKHMEGITLPFTYIISTLDFLFKKETTLY